MKNLFAALVFFFVPLSFAAAYERVSIGGEIRSCYTIGQGFGSERLSVRMSGSLWDRFHYAVFQNFNRAVTKENPLAATDWANISWQPNEHWALTAGKQMSFIGGCEYDSRAVDILYGSQWWNNVNCFLPGVSGQYFYNEGRGTVALEVSSSPYGKLSQNFMGYDLYWKGASKGCWTPIWSTNLFQYADRGYVHYVVIGNRFSLGKFTVETDLLHGADINDYRLFRDWTAIGYARWNICEKISIFTKCIYDKTPSDAAYIPIALKDTDVYKLGGGVEFFPIGNVRIHALYYRQNESNISSLGVSWWFNIYKR